MNSDAKTDIWMPLAIGDYLADTSHLSTLEHGAYLLLLMHYWRKGPLPNDVAKIAQIAKLERDAWSIAQALLGEFFSLHDDGLYHQKRSDREIAKWQGKRLKAKEKAQAAACARWKDHSPSNAPSIPPGNAQAMLGSCPSPKPKPDVRELTLSSPEPATGPRPFDFLETWNRLCGRLPKVESFPDSRRQKVMTRIRQGITIERFGEAVRACTEKPFLRGENKDGWTADFDWLIKNDTNIEKALTQYNHQPTALSKRDPYAGMIFANAGGNTQ
jgi:uncharacterized protein YdaU (DUF1376 family)